MCVGIGMGGTVIWENPNWEGSRANELASSPMTERPGTEPTSASEEAK
jgi:hypothetical protein